jgi:hypothetical protein
MPSGVGTGGWGTRPARAEKTRTGASVPRLLRFVAGAQNAQEGCSAINARSETGSPAPSR